MWHKEKSKNPIVRLALLLALVSTPVMSNFLKSDYVLAQSATETPSFPLPTAVPQGTTIRIDGSTSMIRANESLKQRFEKEYSGTNVELASNGTNDALKALEEGKIDIAAIGRGLTPEEETGLEQQRLRREKIAIVVGKDNPYKGNLTNQEFTRIYRGEITDWSELGGPSGKIRVIDRPDISDTREAFRNYPLFRGNLFKTGSTATQLDSDDPAEVVKQLGNDGIGFVLANQVSKLDNVRILSMHNTLPNDPRYPYSQPLVYVFKKNPSEAVKNFVGFAAAAPGQEALEQAREQEAVSVAQTVAQAVSGNAAPTPVATTTTGNNNVAGTEVGTATNTSANSNASNNNQAFVPAESAGVSAEATKGIPWWWILLPVAALGALVLWWLLGRRRSQEDDTVARGVLPADSPPPFTPTSTASGAVAEPIANTPVEPAANMVATSEMNAAGLGTAAVLSSDEDTSDIRESGAEYSSELRLDEPDLPHPDIPDTGLDLEAPAAVVNSSYHSLPRISTPVEEEVPPTTPDNTAEVDRNASSQEVPSAASSWLGNFALGGAAAAGAARIKSKLANKDVAESVDLGSQHSQFPDVWETPETQRSRTHDSAAQLPDDTLDNSNNTELNPEEQPQVTQSPIDLWADPEPEQDASLDVSSAATGAAAVDSELWNQEQETSNDNAELNPEEQPQVTRSPIDLWADPEPEQDASLDVSSAATEAAAVDSELWNQEQETSNDNAELNPEEQPQVTRSPTDLWGYPETEQDASLDVGSAATGAAALDGIPPVGSELWNQEQHTSDDIAELNPEEQPQVTRSPADLWEDSETEQDASLVGSAAIGAAALDGIPPVGSESWNQEQHTSDDNAELNPEEQPQVTRSPADLWEDSETEQNTASNVNIGTGWFLNRFKPNKTQDSEAQLFKNDLPEVRIIGSNEQLTAIATPPQEQIRTNPGGLPNVWVTQPNPQPTTSEQDNFSLRETLTRTQFVENTSQEQDNLSSEDATRSQFVENTSQEQSEEQVAQFGISSKEDNLTSAGAAVLGVGAFAVGSQILDNESEQDENPATTEPLASQVSFGEDVALDQIADEAEVDPDTQMPSSEPNADEEDTAWDRIYGIHHDKGMGVPGESNIVLANRTPKWAYASWHISADSKEAMQNRGATQLVLRLYDVTNVDLSYQDAKLVQQYECEATVSHRYVAIPNTDRDYVAEVGYLSKEKEWLLISRSPVVRVFSRPHKDFWFEADAELIIHGATEPGSSVTIDGQNIKVKHDGTFHLRIPFTESMIDYLFTAVAADSEQARTIHMQFSQKEPKNS